MDMVKKKILVVGKNSFIGKHFLMDSFENNCIKKIGHEELSETLLSPAHFDVVVNFSIAPSAYSENYSYSNDTNIIIAKAIEKRKDCILIMMSTRQVYGVAEYNSEKILTSPGSHYGANKLKVEDQIVKILGLDRVAILRCSNIYGFEINRKTFMGIMSSSLLKEDRIYLDFPATTAKDFLPVKVFVQILIDVIRARLTGILNIGSGVAVNCRKLADVLCQGYGSGRVIHREINSEESFVLDVSKIRNLIDYPVINETGIFANIEDLGRELRKYSNQYTL
jgi:nucleoside-diphosphate-sugar epimerase